MARLFGTDGVRGLANDLLTPTLAVQLGEAAARVLTKDTPAARRPRSGRPRAIVGRDTRASGEFLDHAISAGLASSGIDVTRVGVLPTPAIAHLTATQDIELGVMISASHNPFPDNGIKFFSADGNKLPDEMEEAIEALLDEPIVCVDSNQLGKAHRVDGAAGRYIEFCKSTFPYSLDLKGLKLVVDCANGAAYHTAPHVFHQLGAEVGGVLG